MATTTEQKREQNGWKVYGTLLSGITAANDGSWQPIFGIYPLSVTLEGDFVGTAKVLVSNAVTKPADTEHDCPQLGSDLSAAGAVTIDAPYKWCKVRVTVRTSGTLSAYVASGTAGRG